MDLTDLRQAHEPAVPPAAPQPRARKEPPRPRHGIKELLAAAALAWTQSSFSADDARFFTEEASTGMTQPEAKRPTEVGVDALPWESARLDEQKEEMRRTDVWGTEARARNRRVQTWETYLKFMDREEAEQAVDRTTQAGVDRVTFRQRRIDRLRTSVGEGIGAQFRDRVATHAEEAAKTLLLAPEMPKTREEAGIVIDEAIQHSLRAAYLEAQREGWKGVNLFLADTLAMDAFSAALRNLSVDFPGLASRDDGPLFAELRNRAESKRSMEEELPDLRRQNTDSETGVIVPGALPETQKLVYTLADDQFAVLGRQGALRQLDHLRHHPRDIRLLAATQLTWFEDHVAGLRADPSLRSLTIAQISHLLRPELNDGTDERTLYRLSRLRDRLMTG